MVPVPTVRRRQRGITLIGMLFLVSFIGLFVFAAVRLTPVYMEYMNIVKAHNSLKGDAGGGGNVAAIQRALDRQFDIDDVHSVTAKDIEIARDGGELTVHATYDAYTPFIGNVGFLVHFDKVVTVTGASGP
jgi:hypothetical protein